MNKRKVLALATGAFLVSQFCASSQTAYFITLRATSYQTNGSGDFFTIPLTEQTLLQDIAALGGRDPNGLRIVYTLQPGGNLGDTIDVVNASDGSFVVNVFGFFFGDDSSLGRSAATNSSLTEIHRLDYVYTQQNFTYTSFNTHSMGASFTTKRFLTDSSNNVHATIDGPIQWIVNPENGNGTKVISGSFTTTTPFAPSP